MFCETVLMNGRVSEYSPFLLKYACILSATVVGLPDSRLFRLERYGDLATRVSKLGNHAVLCGSLLLWNYVLGLGSSYFGVMCETYRSRTGEGLQDFQKPEGQRYLRKVHWSCS